MKRNNIILLLLAMLTIASCKKDKSYSEDINGSPTSYPEITLNGSSVLSINSGESYNDMGFEATDSLYPNNIKKETVGEVDASTPGMYIIVYTATNEKGLRSQATRLVAVTDIDDNFDISGDYLRTATGGLGRLEKIGRGIYSFANCGGLPLNVYPSVYYVKLYMCFLDSSTVECPLQPASTGQAYLQNVNVDYASPMTLSWVLQSPGFGKATRVFEKQ